MKVPIYYEVNFQQVLLTGVSTLKPNQEYTIVAVDQHRNVVVFKAMVEQPDRVKKIEPEITCTLCHLKGCDGTRHVQVPGRI